METTGAEFDGSGRNAGKFRLRYYYFAIYLSRVFNRYSFPVDGGEGGGRAGRRRTLLFETLGEVLVP